MSETLYRLSLPAAILQRGFWLYVWEVNLPNDRKTYYVGMTGDTGSAKAQSAINRVSAHLGNNIKNNALRRYLERCYYLELEASEALEFFAFGPIYPVPPQQEYSIKRGQVAALEKRLWLRMKAAGYDMLNPQPDATACVDEPRWQDVCAAFRERFPNLSTD
jgi:hypothetical protein